MTDELKPVRCGCGGQASCYFTHYWGKCFTVQCSVCGIETKPCDTEAEAVTAWNRAMRRAKVDVLQNTAEDKGEMPFCPHCGDELEWEK